ncbi:multicopper oxidase family protein [Streptomyces aureocirculatus]|uniref:multicopper oxidase family protein n=1 Tax=Streptomyces aureocirculatus TaxID=67275 RepID=UPI00069029FA|nr:multicopper oxidase family protein [Streptomyces aureocirculatus]
MFAALYWINAVLTLAALPLWLLAGQLTGRLRKARTLGRLRRTSWAALTATLLALLPTATTAALIGGALGSYGTVVMADRLYVQFPMILAALAVVLVKGLPGLWRTARVGGDAAEPVPVERARAAAGPWLVVPVQINAVVTAISLYLWWISPPLGRSAMVWWAVLLVAALALVVRQRRRRDALGSESGGVTRLVSVMRIAAASVVVLVVVGGGLVWSAERSRLPERHSANGHGDYDLGGGPDVPRAAAGHQHAVPVAASGRSVDSLTERDLSGPVRRFTLTARTARIRLDSGRTIDAWTFNGSSPGPELRVRQGDLVEVTLVNADIEAGVTLHWHGYDVPNAADGAAGVTQNAVAPGHRMKYRFRAKDAGSYWYHSHQQSAEQVQRGLYGALIVEPGPVKGADIAVLYREWGTDAVAGGARVFGTSDGLRRQRISPGTPVRLRLVNTVNDPVDLTLAGSPFRVAAIDGGELHGPGEIRGKALPMAAGGRYDLTFTMPAHPVELRRADTGGPALVLSPDGRGRAPAQATNGTFDPASYGTPTATPFGPGTRYDRHFTLNIDSSFGFFDGRPALRYRINGRVFPDIPNMVVREGETIKMTFVNRSDADHPMHLHGHHVQVLTRNGKRVTGASWRADSLNVAPGETYDVAFKADNPGLWMDHCHNLFHAKVGMMLHLAYAGVTTPYDSGTATPNQPE